MEQFFSENVPANAPDPTCDVNEMALVYDFTLWLTLLSKRRDNW
jgi:hypothetical protein